MKTTAMTKILKRTKTTKKTKVKSSQKGFSSDGLTTRLTCIFR